MNDPANCFPARFLHQRMGARATRPVRLTMLAIALLGITALAATALFPQVAMASDPPGPCEDGYVAPTPVAVAVTDVPIEVTSTTADYFVLYAKQPLNGQTTYIPVAAARGENGATTLSDNLAPLAADQYRVEKYQVANPADVDGDCVDDVTELDDLGAYNPINSAKKIKPLNGAVAIDSHAAFEKLAFRGVSHEDHLDGIRFVKFWIFDPDTDSPEVFFLNTKKHVYHNPFVRSIGYPQEVLEDAWAGQLVWHPNVPAPDGTLGSYRFEWGSFAARTFAGTERAYTLLAASMPLLEDNLYFYPESTPFFSSYWDERKKFDASRIHILLEHQVLAEVDYIALNQAEAYGRLRLMENDDRPSPYDVAIYKSLPNDLPRVAGTITTVPQTPLSHVNLRAIQNGLPNAFIRDVLKEDAITSLLDNYVYYAVTADGYTIRAATKKEVDDHHESLRPKSAQTLQSDLTVTEIASLADVSFDDWTAFGVKAANVAELAKLSLPEGTTPLGYAVPFYFYYEFMKQATVAEETILGKKKAPDEEKITLAAGTTLASAVTQMLAHSYFQSDADIQEEMLDDLRDAIKDAASPKFITDALTVMHAKYPDGQSLRYRSSTNNEDLPSFNGAGLYSSKTQEPDETAEDGIDKSIKGVWASLWNYRAFLERDFHRVDHTTVYMGVLVHPNYSDETVNGVAVSYDPITFQDNAYYVNSQMGEDLVTNPEAYSQPEQLLLGPTGGATVMSRSNLIDSNQLLMTDAQMRQLRSNLETIHDHFKTLYAVQDDDDYAIEIEFKITADNKLAIKQARPWIFAEPLELTPTVTIALSSAQATEGAGLELTATRSSGVLSMPLTIGLTWRETRAMLASARPASVTIPVNQTTATINVPFDDDQEDEHDSVVTASIAADSKYVIGTPGSASATVTDDDLTQIAVRADAGTVLEGATADFKFTRSGSVLEQPLTVDVTISETGGNRLTGALPTTVTFAANSATASVSLPTADDSEVTGTSVVTVQISAGSAYGIAGSGSARVTVEDDEVPGPTLLFAADHAVGAGKVSVVPLETRGSRIGDLTFAIAGPDTGAFVLYGDSGLLVFNDHNYDPPGDANQDGVYEIDFTAEHNSGGRHGSTTARLRFTVTNAELISLAAQQWDQTSQAQRETLLPDVPSSRLRPAFASLAADVQAMALRLARQQQLPSPGPAISITAGSDITEGGNASFTVTANPAPAAALSVSVAVSQSGDFGVAPGSQTVTIPTAGSATLTVATGDDQTDEANGSVTATVNRGNGYLVSWAAGTATVAVTDDDVAPPSTTPEIGITAGSGVTEGGDATFTLTANPSPTADMDVSVSVSQSGDFGVTPGTQTVTIPTSGSYTLTVATVNDGVDETDGSVTATVGSGQGYTVSGTAGSATVAVADDDVPEVSITGGSGVTEGNNASFTLTANPAPHAPLDVSVSVSQTGDFGVTPGSQTVTVPTTGAATLTVSTVNDSVDEANGSASATVNSGQGYTVSTTARAATVAVADDDDPPPAATPEVSVTAGSGVTEGGNATFTVSANPAPAAALSVSVGITQSGDYGVTPSTQTVSIPTGGSATLTVATVNDSVDESDGSVTATVNSGTGYTVSATAGAATVAVADDDVPEISIAAGSGITEGGNASFTVTASPAPHAPLSVSVAVSQAGDFGVAAGPQTVSIPTTGSATLTVATGDDNVDEADGSVTATVSSGTGYTVSATAGSATVAVADDDDTAPQTCTPNLPSDAITVSEVKTWRGEYSQDSHVSRWNRVLAALGEDTGEAAMTADQAREIKSRIDNTRWDRTVRTLEALEQCNNPPAATPEVSVTAGSGVTEGGNATFTVTANPAPAAALSVSLNVGQTGDFGATTGSQTVTIPTTGSYTLTVATTNDNVDEADGSVTATVSSGTGYTVSATAGSATVAVADDDVPEISIVSNGGITEGGDASFTLTASPAPHAPLAVSVSVSQSGDFGVTPGAQTVSILTTGSATLTVATGDDAVDEADGSVTATVNSGTGYTVSSTAGSATVAVADDDPPQSCTPNLPSDAVTVSEVKTWRGEYSQDSHVSRWNRVLAALGEDTGEAAMTADQARDIKSRIDNTRWDRTVRTLEALEQCNNPPPATPEVSITAGSGITEGGNATFTLSASPTPSSALSVSVGITQSGDYGVSTGSQTVSIPTSGSATLTVATSDDGVDEADGSVTATVNSGQGYTVSATAGAATVAVADDDVPEISIAAGSGITEGGDASFTLTASPAPHAPLSVSVSVSQSGDFGVTPGAQTVSIPTSGSATLTVATSDDSVDEADGSVTATVSSGQGYIVSSTAGSATVAVADDDATLPGTPEISITAGSGVTEGGNATFTLTASPAPTTALDVSVGVAQTGDYGASTGSQTVSIPTSGSYTLTVATVNDGVDEADGSVTVTVGTGQGYTVSATAGAATVAVADDDVPEISITAGSGITEGGDASFTLTANPAPHAPLAVSVSVSQSGDFGVPPGSQTVSIPTTGSYTLTVATVNDGADEADGSVTATVDSSQGYTVSSTAGTATVAVADDDDPPPPDATPSLSVSDASAREDAGVMEFTVSLSAASEKKVQVYAATTSFLHKTATNGDDFEWTQVLLTFAPGETSKTVQVVILDDGISEGDESFGMFLAYSPSDTPIAREHGEGVIIDDD